MSLPKIHKEKRDTDRKKTVCIFYIMVLTGWVSCGKIRIPRNEAATLGVVAHSQGLHTVRQAPVHREFTFLHALSIIHHPFRTFNMFQLNSMYWVYNMTCVTQLSVLYWAPHVMEPYKTLCFSAVEAMRGAYQPGMCPPWWSC